jgi:hypothetical protein
MHKPIAQVRVIDFTDGEPTIGMGFNSITFLCPGTALTFERAPPEPGEDGQVVVGHAHIINSHEELMDSIGVSIAVSGRYGLSSASAKLDYAKSTGYNSTSTFVLAQVSVINPMHRGTHFNLTDVADKLIKAHNLIGFNTAFGDSFVRGIKTGGEFFAVFRLTAIRETTTRSLAAALTADINSGVAGGTFNGVFKTASSDEHDRAEVEVNFYQASGSGPTAGVTLDVESIMGRLRDFPTIARDHPMPYKVELATYDTVPIDITPPEELDDWQESLRHDDAIKLDYIRRLNDVQFARNHPEFFDELPAQAVLDSQTEAYTQLVNAVMGHAMQLAKGAILPEFFDPAKTSPPLTVPDELHFKRKATASVDLGLFEGHWGNTNPGSQLQSMILTPTDATHVNVRAKYKDFEKEVISIGEWNEAAKALTGKVTLIPGRPPLNVGFKGAKYAITNSHSSAQTLIVSNELVFSFVGAPGHGGEVDPFRRNDP